MAAGALGGALSYGVNCLDGAVANPSWTGLAESVALGGVLGGLGRESETLLSHLRLMRLRLKRLRAMTKR